MPGILNANGLFPEGREVTALPVEKKKRAPRKPRQKRATPPTKPVEKQEKKGKEPKIEREKNKQRPTIAAHFITPAGIVTERFVKEHCRFNEFKGVYEVRNVFTDDDGNRLMVISKGNPIPHPANGATSSDAMEGQYVSATIADLSRPAAADLGGMFANLMTKIGLIPPIAIVGVLVLIVLLQQGFFG
jgi:hypothetical protein